MKIFEEKANVAMYIIPKIKEVSVQGGGLVTWGLIVPEEGGFAPVEVSLEYMRKHKPFAGGYYVRYADGYESFSPPAAFETGYTRVS
jgi:hypothetical protein